MGVSVFNAQVARILRPHSRFTYTGPTAYSCRDRAVALQFTYMDLTFMGSKVSLTRIINQRLNANCAGWDARQTTMIGMSNG
eukprot:363280-Chlamydomonas_euryale.AAC.10